MKENKVLFCSWVIKEDAVFSIIFAYVFKKLRGLPFKNPERDRQEYHTNTTFMHILGTSWQLPINYWQQQGNDLNTYHSINPGEAGDELTWNARDKRWKDGNIINTCYHHAIEIGSCQTKLLARIRLHVWWRYNREATCLQLQLAAWLGAA